MIQWQSIEIPQLIKDNCVVTDKGMPVPYIVLEENGVHHFKINDQKKVMDCLIHDKCTICGTELHDDMWFIGGPASAFHKHGAFVDAPVHKCCGEYALKACPYLAYSRYMSKIDLEKLQSKLDNKHILVNPTKDSDRVPLFAFVKASGYKINSSSGNFRPIIPYLEIEYWNDGQQLSQKEGIEIVTDLFTKKYNINDLIDL
jgi:hypothetical protein